MDFSLGYSFPVIMECRWMKSFQAENIKTRWIIVMARRCEICGKGTVAGNIVTHKGQLKKKGGVGQHIGVVKKRTFRPNIVSVKALMSGTPRTIKVCTRCLRSGKVQKVV